MARKPKGRAHAGRSWQHTPQKVGAARRWRLKLVVGGIILALALGVGGTVRFLRQRALAPTLQGAVDSHYTRGTAGAPVVIKEFSDYT